MRTFKDTTGREWIIDITVAVVAEVRGRMPSVNLMSIGAGDTSLIERLAEDPVLLCDVLHVVCACNPKNERCSLPEFMGAMRGDTIDEATRALLEDAVDFSSSPRQRANMQAVLKATWAAMDKAHGLIETKLAGGVLATLEQKALSGVEQALKTLTEPSGAAPAS